MSEPPSVPVLCNESWESNGLESYVSYVLRNERVRPSVTWSNWWKEAQWGRFSLIMIIPPLATLYACFTPLRRETAIWSVVFYLMSGMGITAGYHRLWAHRSYNAKCTLEVVLAFLSTAAAMGPIIWWARLHRAHHRYTDTDLDPYNAKRGLFWTHIGWVIFKPRCKHGRVDISDLLNNPVVMWQLHYYPWLVLLSAVIFPTAVAGLGWGDWQGGFVYSALLRLFFVHQTASCVNSVAHWIGDTPYDDRHSPRDHLLTALLTLGEGYHNFHHQFPMDYRNGIKWYQYDPTKWLIWLCHKVGLASHLKIFSENEILKGEITMELKRLREKQDALTWPHPGSSLPVLSWASYQSQAESRAVVCITGFIHDIEDFLEVHPGGRHLLLKHVGRDATSAFFGGIHDHSSAAHNLLAMKRVGILRGGVPHISEEKLVPPSERLRVVHINEFRSSNVVP
ncbi:delta 9-fatty acid desaturase protein [Boletus reticuloceps]|uniref:Acyl-CoA desaturase n=1 Tax=Boletus reticuloceps TaxID=495285 RepID=A0A8I2YLV5_9AGAM|nr:delta 9-fatty acid desaturase protein [Boletus reticuloceps]